MTTSKQAFKIVNLIYEIKKLCYKFIHQYLTFEKINELYFKSKNINLDGFFNNTSKHFYIFFKNLLESINQFSIDENIDKEFYKDDASILSQCQTAIVGIINNKNPEKASSYFISKLIELINTTCGSIKLLCKELDEKIGLTNYENGDIITPNLDEVDIISKIPKARIFVFFEEQMMFLNKPISYFKRFEQQNDLSNTIKIRSATVEDKSKKKSTQFKKSRSNLVTSNNNSLPPNPISDFSENYEISVGGAHFNSSKKMGVKNQSNMNTVLNKGRVAQIAREGVNINNRVSGKREKLLESEHSISNKLNQIKQNHLSKVFGKDFNLDLYSTDEKVMTAFTKSKKINKVKKFIKKNQIILEYSPKRITGSLKSDMVGNASSKKEFTNNLFELYNLILENLLNLAKSNLVVYMVFTNPTVQNKISISVRNRVIKSTKNELKQDGVEKTQITGRLSGKLGQVFQNTCVDLKDQLPCFSFASCSRDGDATSRQSLSSRSSASSRPITIKQKARIPRGMPLGSLSNASYINSIGHNTYNNSFNDYSGPVTMVGKKSKKNSNNSRKKKTVKNVKSSKTNRGSSKK